VVSNFIVQALKGEDITIYGDGLQTRSFCYVSDLVTGMIGWMDHEGEGCHLPLNMGNPSEFTMLGLAENVLSVVGGRSRITFHSLPKDDPQQRKPDIARAQTELGWSPTVGLGEGLNETVNYFRGVFG